MSSEPHRAQTDGSFDGRESSWPRLLGRAGLLGRRRNPLRFDSACCEVWGNSVEFNGCLDWRFFGASLVGISLPARKPADREAIACFESAARDPVSNANRIANSDVEPQSNETVLAANLLAGILAFGILAFGILVVLSRRCV